MSDFLLPINPKLFLLFAFLLLLHSQLATITLASSSTTTHPNDMSATNIQETRPSESVTLPKSNSAAPAKSPADGYGSPEESRSFIITFKKDTTKEQLDKYEAEIIKNGGSIKHRYDSIIMKGFAVSVQPSRLQSLQQDPQISHVEPDGEVHI